MHDPKVVAWEIVLPFPKRGWKNNDAKPGDYRWGTRRLRTNPENLGEPVFPWYRPRGYTPFRIAGKALRWWPLGTIWHNEPNGRDALTVCRHRVTDDGGKFIKFSNVWKWHVHHWSFQWFFEQKLRRFLFERCQLCGRRFPWGYAPVSHQWDAPKSRWWHIEKRSYHHECSSLVFVRRIVEQDKEITKKLIGLLSVAGRDESDVIDWLTGLDSPIGEFNLRYRLQNMFGYERDDNYRLVKKETAS